MIYFDGAGAWPWLTHLAIWLVAALALSAVLGVRKATSVRLATDMEPSLEPSLTHPRHIEA